MSEREEPVERRRASAPRRHDDPAVHALSDTVTSAVRSLVEDAVKDALVARTAELRAMVGREVATVLDTRNGVLLHTMLAQLALQGAEMSAAWDAKLSPLVAWITADQERRPLEERYDAFVADQIAERTRAETARRDMRRLMTGLVAEVRPWGLTILTVLLGSQAQRMGMLPSLWFWAMVLLVPVLAFGWPIYQRLVLHEPGGPPP